jgi:hypothetical protein
MCGREQRASGSDEWVLGTAELRAFIAYVQGDDRPGSLPRAGV